MSGSVDLKQFNHEVVKVKGTMLTDATALYDAVNKQESSFLPGRGREEDGRGDPGAGAGSVRHEERVPVDPHPFHGGRRTHQGRPHGLHVLASLHRETQVEAHHRRAVRVGQEVCPIVQRHLRGRDRGRVAVTRREAEGKKSRQQERSDPEEEVLRVGEAKNPDPVEEYRQSPFPTPTARVTSSARKKPAELRLRARGAEETGPPDRERSPRDHADDPSRGSSSAETVNLRE